MGLQVGYTGDMSTTSSWALPADDAHGEVARRAVQSALAHHPRIEDVELVVNELASNAFRHGSPPQTLHIEVESAGRVLVRVSEHETLRRPTLHASGEPGVGFGLGLVASVADDWGWSLADGVLVVWASFD